MKDKLAIIENDFGLIVEPLDSPLVYKVINTDKKINVSELLIALEKATVFYSKDYERIEKNKRRSTLASVYCIILDYRNTELNYEYKGRFMDSITEEYIKGRRFGEDIGIITDM